jgi:excisionase family DNA binding protein
MSSLSPPNRLLYAEEVAEMIGMTKGWVYAQTREDQIPHVRLGRCYRYRAEAIEAWLIEIERNGVIAGSRKLLQPGKGNRAA